MTLNPLFPFTGKRMPRILTGRLLQPFVQSPTTATSLSRVSASILLAGCYVMLRSRVLGNRRLRTMGRFGLGGRLGVRLGLGSFGHGYGLKGAWDIG